MKVLLFVKNASVLSKSGIGRAMQHQKEALTAAGVDYTFDPNDTYDLVHINTIDLAAKAMAKKARRLGKKVVYHAHSTEEDFKNSFIFSNQIAPLFKKHIMSCYRLGDLILTPTPYSKKLLEGYGLTQPIQDISNGIYLERFEPSEAKQKAFYEYFNLDSTSKVVVSVGLYFERKGLHDFIEVARHFPDVTFIWFGHTPLVSTTSTIRKAIKEKPENVILPGYIRGDIIEGAYQCADLFFFPSYEETEGIVVLEALASRVQVILRDIDVYKPWMEDGVSCYMGSDNESFKALIQSYYDETMTPTIHAGYEVAQERSIENIGHKLKRIYQEVLDEA